MEWTRIEGIAYWGFFTFAFLGVAVWESFRPRTDLSVPAQRRWGNHSLLMVICTIASMLVLRVAPVGMALIVARSPYGALNKTWLPAGLRVVVTILLLDLVRYFAHRLLHSFEYLWRVHQVHHSDPDFDVSTGLRVHPIETLILQGSTLAAVALLAPPVTAVLVSELLSLFETFFSHANTCLPNKVERWASAVIYTPDIHRIHHSIDIVEQNTNFGDVFSFWDRLFGTYKAVAGAGNDGMITGVAGLEGHDGLRLGFMLRLPFIKQPEPTAPQTAWSDGSTSETACGRE